MAILRGFPPSNMISPTTYMPIVMEIILKIMNVPTEEKFRVNSCEFMRMSNTSWGDPRAICYKGDAHNHPGSVYGFGKETEVVWLREVYGGTDMKIHPADCCQYCGQKLTSDFFSARYGDWCANEKCFK